MNSSFSFADALPRRGLRKPETRKNRTILYDSHRWRTLCKVQGSVLPKACIYALIPALVAFALKYSEDREYIELPKLISTSAAFGGFSWTVSFLLVFRTSQCYSRFWSCAVGASGMRAQIYEACASLAAFCSVSDKSAHDVKVFKIKIIQLFSMFHANAIASVSNVEHLDFPIVGADYVPKKQLDFLKKMKGEKRVEVLYQWLNTLITTEHHKGVLKPVPPPIMNGVYNEIGKAMEKYIDIVQIITIPFPFPYSQVCLVMIMVYMLVTPLVMVTWTETPFGAFLFTLISSMCFWSLELIAAELENPFGTDVNDLPIWSFQEEFNEGLLMLVDSVAMGGYDLEDSAKARVETWDSMDDLRNTEKCLTELDYGQSNVWNESLPDKLQQDKESVPVEIEDVLPVLLPQPQTQSPPQKDVIPAMEPAAHVKAQEPKDTKTPAAGADNCVASISQVGKDHMDPSLVDALLQQRSGFDKELLDRLTQIQNSIGRHAKDKL